LIWSIIMSIEKIIIFESQLNQFKKKEEEKNEEWKNNINPE